MTLVVGVTLGCTCSQIGKKCVLVLVHVYGIVLCLSGVSKHELEAEAAQLTAPRGVAGAFRKLLQALAFTSSLGKRKQEVRVCVCAYACASACVYVQLYDAWVCIVRGCASCLVLS